MARLSQQSSSVSVKESASDNDSEEINAVIGKRSYAEQNQEAEKTSDSVVDLVNNFDPKSPSIPASSPLFTANPLSFRYRRVVYIERVAAQCVQGQYRCHIRVNYCFTTWNRTFATSDQLQQHYGGLAHIGNLNQDFEKCQKYYSKT